MAILNLVSCGGSNTPGLDSSTPEPQEEEPSALDVSGESEAANWRDALVQLSKDNVSAYSYVIYEGNLSLYPGPKFGFMTRLGVAQGADICPQDRASSSMPADGWSLTVYAADIREGVYLFSQGRGGQVFNQKENMQFLGHLERFLDGKSVGYYIASQGRLELNHPIVPFAERDFATEISGSLHLTFPTTPVKPLSCVVVGDVAAGTTSETCECLLDDAEVVVCVPEGPEDQCCLRQVPEDSIDIDIPFVAPPCAAICTAHGLGSAGFCNSLASSSFDDTLSP